jgi:hypothetical protein
MPVTIGFNEHIDAKSGLTDTELKIMDHLVEAYCDFRKLPYPRRLEDERMAEFVVHIHALQRILGQRVLSREHLHYWSE